jgi:hypothetical protein
MSPIHVATSDGLVAVATARWGGETTVEVEVLDHPPAIDLHAWDRIVECSIDVPSGRLRVYSVEEDLDAAPTIDLAPGNYLILVQSADLDTVPDDTGTEGDDHYRLTLWPGSPVEPRMIK